MAKTPLSAWIALAALASACANPTTAYQRQLEYACRMGEAAAAEGRFDEALEHLREAAELAPFAQAGDLELAGVLTRLGDVSRRTGRAGEAAEVLAQAGRALDRYRAREGTGASAYRRVAGSHALARARVLSSLGDLVAAEASLATFFEVRGRRGSRDAREAAEAHWLLGELLLARDLEVAAREEFRSALERVRDLEGEADGADESSLLRSAILLRAAETEVEEGRAEAARALAEETRPGGVLPAPLRPGWLLVQARIDAAEPSLERAAGRLQEALDLLTEGGVPATGASVASLGRAALVASLVYDLKTQAAELEQALDRSMALVPEAPPLDAMLLGRALIAVGRDWIAAGDRPRGVRALDHGRRAIQRSTDGRAHVALVQADFEIATALASIGRLDFASKRCERVQQLARQLELVEAEQTERLVACGRIAARAGEEQLARDAFLDALSRGEAEGDAGLRFELLIRLAALARTEQRSSAEAKLFERVLPLLGDGEMLRLPDLLTDAYGPLGSVQPSSAAARMGHVAVRTREHQSAAGRLQGIAARLADARPAPAALR